MKEWDFPLFRLYKGFFPVLAEQNKEKALPAGRQNRNKPEKGRGDLWHPVKKIPSALSLI